MKTKITFEHAFEISETLVAILKETTPEGMRPYEVRALFMLKKFDTNNLKEIKERISKDFYHIPKQLLEVKLAKTIKLLLEKDLVCKGQCAEDKRQALLDITPKGKKLLESIYSEAKQKWEEATNG